MTGIKRERILREKGKRNKIKTKDGSNEAARNWKDIGWKWKNNWGKKKYYLVEIECLLGMRKRAWGKEVKRSWALMKMRSS